VEASPKRPRERRGAVLAGSRSTTPPRLASRARCFQPCAELATMPLAPSVATLRESPSRRAARPGLPRRLVKDDSSCRTRAPSIERVLPPPAACRAFAWRAWDLEEPATGVAARVLVALATATRLPTRFRRSSRRALYTPDGKWLDPWPFGWTERRSSTSATKTAREHARQSPDLRLVVERPRRGEVAWSAIALGRSLARRRIHHPRERMVVAATPALALFRDGTFRHRCKAREFELE